MNAMLQFLVVLVCFGCVCCSQDQPILTRKTHKHGYEALPSLSELGVDKRTPGRGPIISGEYKSAGTSRSDTKTVNVASTNMPTMFYSSALQSLARQELRYYLPYFPNETTTIQNFSEKNATTQSQYFSENSTNLTNLTDLDISAPSGYENASWAPVSDVFITTSEKEYVLLNGVCRMLPFTYYDPLSISPYTVFSHTTTIRGTPSDVFKFFSPEYNVTLYVEQANNSIPLKFVGETDQIVFTNNYKNFVGDVDFSSSSLFDIPDSCTPPGPICEGDVENLEILRFHSPDNLDLADQNGADEIGVVSFLCASVLQDAEPGYDWISKFNVTVDTAYGVYGLCNFHNCWTPNQNAVGREVSYGLTDNGGQCDPVNTMFGEWYSFTSTGECPSNVSVSPENQCSWKTNSRLDTVGLDCLVSIGFMDACRNDKGFPFASATATLTKGFDVCPDPAASSK